MAEFRGHISDLTGEMIHPSDYTRLRITARGDDGVLHEQEIDIASSELEKVLPQLHTGEKMQLVVRNKRGPKPKQEV